MNVRRVALPVLLTFMFAVGRAATLGEFRGKIINPPYQPEPVSTSSCIYVLGRNHLVRKVVIQKAEIIYGASVPTEERRPHPATSLLEGAEVRVTATQGKDGNWQAKQVEILRTAPQRSDPRAGKI